MTRHLRGITELRRETAGDQPIRLTGALRAAERNALVDAPISIASSRTPPSSGFSTMLRHAGWLARARALRGLVASTMSMTGMPSPAKRRSLLPFSHAREHVLIEHEAAGRRQPRPWRGGKECSSQSRTSKPSSSSEKRKELARTPSPTAIRMVSGFRQIKSPSSASAPRKLDRGCAARYAARRASYFELRQSAGA